MPLNLPIVHNQIAPYGYLRNIERNNFIASGIIGSQNVNVDNAVTSPTIAAEISRQLASIKGFFGNVPRWLDSTVIPHPIEKDVRTPATTFVGNSLTYPIFYDQQRFQVTGIEDAVSASDPLGELQNRISDIWTDIYSQYMSAIIEGAFAPGGALASNIVTRATFDEFSLLDAILGTVKKPLTVLRMNNLTLAEIKKWDVSELIPFGDRRNIALKQWADYTIFVDNKIVNPAGQYIIDAFQNGIMAFDIGNPVGMVSDEPWRDPSISGGVDEIISNRAFGIALDGITWAGSTNVQKSPDLSDLQTAANWALLDGVSSDQIGIVRLIA